MIKRIKMLLDRFKVLGYMFHHQEVHGKFYVRYPDGERTVRLDYQTAKTYKELFGGKIYHIDEKEK